MGVPKELLRYLTPVIIFYAVGDYVTTLIGLQLGCQELNPVMQGIVTDPLNFIAVKAVIVLLLCLYYRYNSTWKYRHIPFVLISAVGATVTLTNTWFILEACNV